MIVIHHTIKKDEFKIDADFWRGTKNRTIGKHYIVEIKDGVIINNENRLK